MTALNGNMDSQTNLKNRKIASISERLWKECPLQDRGLNGEQKVRLILGRVDRRPQLRRASGGIAPNARVVPGGHPLRTQILGAFPEAGELDELVAADARARRPPGLQLRAGAQRVLGSARPARGRLALLRSGGAGGLPRSRRISDDDLGRYKM